MKSRIALGYSRKEAGALASGLRPNEALGRRKKQQRRRPAKDTAASKIKPPVALRPDASLRDERGSGVLQHQP